ncbi:MAG: ATP-dependent DNA helicase RecQ, partial [Prevotellaceae bacterium]|nr:ATP-dependent DNA helicase RecQ [Prevotellaceae bacterium]
HTSSIESYVQEAGRGGRDRCHAMSYILFEPTEYIQFTPDKINDIRYLLTRNGNDPVWLEQYSNNFVLLDDIPELCGANGCSAEQTANILQIIRSQGFLENVDKGIDLWFHNNSFRGQFKEKVMLAELTDRILNVKPDYRLEIQGKLQDMTGNDDAALKVNPTKNSITIISKEDPSKQYGYIFLDTLTPVFKYLNFDLGLCEYMSRSLIEILATYEDHSAKALLRPLEGEDNQTEGIYHAMQQVGRNEYAYVYVSWENWINQNWDEFELSIKREISEIAHSQSWNDIDEEHNGKFDLRRVSDFDDLLNGISKYSGDSRWLRAHGNEALYRKLRLAFCRKRDKDDTDKAIYRMCCIGLVEDVTVDYLSQMYELKVRNHTDKEFNGFMLNFFRKYYSLEQAQARVDQIDSQKGRNYLDKCLGYLTKFVYESLEKKRYRAIEDMRIACENSIEDRKITGNDDWLKEFIHLYFNSKYARIGYNVDGKDFSLTDDTDSSGRDDFDIVRKYVKVMTVDNSGSEVDNVKHLYGATLLCLRAHPDNAALQLLLTYCITFLGAGTNETLKSSAFNGYVDGFMEMYRQNVSDFWECVDEFSGYIKAAVHENDSYIRENIVEKGPECLTFLIHEERFDTITNEYIK